MIPLNKIQEGIKYKIKERRKVNKLLANFGWVLLVLFLGFIIFLVWWYSSEYITAKFPNPSERGTFGDQFGAINALFSGLAFAGIIITILLQGRELSLQRKELEQTREVFNQQKFETTYFQLLKLIQDNLANIKFKTTKSQSGQIIKESEYIGSEANYRYYKHFYLDRISIEKEIDSEMYINYSQSFFDEFQLFDPFIFSIQNSLKFIYNSNIENKSFYFDLLKGQLSDNDKIIIFLYILNKDNFEFKIRVVDSELIKGIKSEYLFHDNIQKILYIVTVDKITPNPSN